MRQLSPVLTRLGWTRGLLLAISVAACDGPVHPLNSPTPIAIAPAIVTLQVLATDSRVELHAFVSAIDRSPVAGVTVHFAASAGSVTPTEAVADRAGVAGTVWTGVGNAVVTAAAGEASAAASVSHTLAPLEVMLSVTPLVRYQPGTFTARVFDMTAPATYVWSFGDGGTATTSANTTTHTYRNDDALRASVTVTDGAGRTGTGSTNLFIAQP